MLQVMITGIYFYFHTYLTGGDYRHIFVKLKLKLQVVIYLFVIFTLGMLLSLGLKPSGKQHPSG